MALTGPFGDRLSASAASCASGFAGSSSFSAGACCAGVGPAGCVEGAVPGSDSGWGPGQEQLR